MHWYLKQNTKRLQVHYNNQHIFRSLQNINDMKLKDNFIGLSTFLGLLGAGASCSGPASAPQSGPVPVTVEAVKTQNAGFFDVYPANVVALNEVELRSEVNGFITDINFQEGQTVVQGQKL